MRAGLVVAALALFVVLATANSGGYRYGVSDQAFYVPAIELAQHPDLFPRDRTLLEPQMRLWLGGRLAAAAARWTGDDLPSLFAVIYLVTIAGLCGAALALGRGLGYDAWSTSAFLLLLTLKHRIAKTGANSLEGYAHPRMLAFAIGVGVMASLVRRRVGLAMVLSVAALVVHPTTGAWFALLVALAVAWSARRDRTWRLGMLGIVAVGAALLPLLAGRHLVTMDPAWLTVLADKDYLFPAGWPLYAWLTNLAYPVVLVAIFRQRRRRGVAAPGEEALVAGLVGLVGVFLVSVPLTMAHLALAVQLQVNRVFWLLDVGVAAYVAWWLVDGLARRPAGRRLRVAGLILLAAASVGRGAYVLRVEAGRPLAEIRPAPGAWADVMAWLRQQPSGWCVLADPDHAWKYGMSVRVAALRDTLLEAGKDSAMAMYDRNVAMRVAERSRALAGFDDLTAARALALRKAFGADVLVDRRDRPLDLPVLYQNAGFVVYDLR
jgi:hypothetical protein